MVTTAVLTQEDNLSLYLQICADAYGENLAKENPISNSDWEKLNLVIDGKVSDEYYYDFNKIFDENNGFDAAIYYNSKTNEVIIGIRGTELTANDGDVSESATILNCISDLTQFEKLENFYEVVLDTLLSINYNGTYKIVGQSLGGALASVYASKYNSDVSEVITINPIGVAYEFEQNQKVTNYLVMNDIFAMLNYDQQIGSVKLVFPIKIENAIDVLAPHNDVIFIKKEATNFVNYVLDIDASKWSSEKGVSIWYYDKNNIWANQLMKFEYKAALGLLSGIAVALQTKLPLDSVEAVATVVNLFAGAIKDNIDNISNLFLTTEDIEERENALKQLIMSDEDTVSVLASKQLTMLEYIDTIWVLTQQKQ